MALLRVNPSVNNAAKIVEFAVVSEAADSDTPADSEMNWLVRTPVSVVSALFCAVADALI